MTTGAARRPSCSEAKEIEVAGIRMRILQQRKGHKAPWRARGGAGGSVWPASEALAQWLGTQRAGTHERLVPEVASAQLPTVLELGAGAGVVSIALSLLGAPHAVATDGEPLSCELCRANALANCATAVVTCPLVWGSSVQLEDVLACCADGGRCARWVVAADVLYCAHGTAALELSLRSLLARGGCELVVFGWVARGHHEEEFLWRLRDLGTVSTVERLTDARFGYLCQGGGRQLGAALEFGVTLLRVHPSVTAGMEHGGALSALRQQCGLLHARAVLAARSLPCCPA